MEKKRKIIFIYICLLIGILGMEAGGLQYNLLLIAEELGLLDKVLENGWRSLSAKETGKVGGICANMHVGNNTDLGNGHIFRIILHSNIKFLCVSLAAVQIG